MQVQARSVGRAGAHAQGRFDERALSHRRFAKGGGPLPLQSKAY